METESQVGEPGVKLEIMLAILKRYALDMEARHQSPSNLGRILGQVNDLQSILSDLLKSTGPHRVPETDERKTGYTRPALQKTQVSSTQTTIMSVTSSAPLSPPTSSDLLPVEVKLLILGHLFYKAHEAHLPIGKRDVILVHLPFHEIVKQVYRSLKLAGGDGLVRPEYRMFRAIRNKRPLALRFALKDVRPGWIPLIQLALLHASRCKEKAMRRLLAEVQGDLNLQPLRRPGSFDARPIGTAASAGCLDLVEYLLARGANINGENGLRDSALHQAATTEAIQFFLSHKAYNGKFDQENANEETPLWKATQRNNVKVMEILIRLGANACQSDHHGEILLHVAAGAGFEDATRLLLEGGAKVNDEDEQGKTALHHATEGKHTAVVKLLIAHRAELGVKDNYGMTPLEYAKEQGYKDGEELLACDYRLSSEEIP